MLDECMPWKVAQAKQRLSEVIRMAEKEPQILQNRDRVVGAVIASEDVAPYLAWRQSHRERSVADLLAEASRICADTKYVFEVPPRATRPLAMTWPSDVSSRHKRR
jgi:hypothetical protein